MGVVDDPPKAVFYCWPGSFLSMVPRLALLEKGFDENEYIIQLVDAGVGETFSPSFLSVTNTGTLPVLVLPTIEAVEGKNGKNVTKTHALSGATKILAFLDQARTPYKASPVDGRIPPMLSPYTDSERALTESLIRLVCTPQIDPNFIELSARDPAELQAKRRGAQGSMLSSRQMAIERYLAEARARLGNPSSSKRRASPSQDEALIEFLEEKKAVNESLLAVYNGDAGHERQNDFFESSCASWRIHLPSALGKLERLMIGPFALGDDLKFPDCYIIMWLARIVAICGGEPTFSGLSALEHHLKGYRIGTKLQYYWGHWIQRSSFRRMQLSTSVFANRANSGKVQWRPSSPVQKPVALSWG